MQRVALTACQRESRGRAHGFKGLHLEAGRAASLASSRLEPEFEPAPEAGLGPEAQTKPCQTLCRDGVLRRVGHIGGRSLEVDPDWLTPTDVL